MKKKTYSAKIKLKVGDQIKVISGKEKGKISKVISVLRDQNKIIAEGVNVKVKHFKLDQEGKGEKIKKIEFPIHISNVLKHKDSV